MVLKADGLVTTLAATNNNGNLTGVSHDTLHMHTYVLYTYVYTVGIKKKFPRSIRTKGARLKKTGGERVLNGN